jgi:hypothetical protein
MTRSAPPIASVSHERYDAPHDDETTRARLRLTYRLRHSKRPIGIRPLNPES